MNTRVIVENLDEQFIRRIKEIEKLSEELSLEFKEVIEEKRHCESLLIELSDNIKEKYGFENASCLRYNPKEKQLLSYSGQILVKRVDDDFVFQLEKYYKLEKNNRSDISFIKARKNVLDAKNNNLIYDIKNFYKLEKVKGFLSYDLEKKQILVTENIEEALKEMFIKDFGNFLKSLGFENFEP